ncbi:hypothetical protein QQ045_010996 [Rhodiola kirilowii]
MKIIISPDFNHRALQLLQKCKTLKWLHQIHSHFITSGLTNHTYPLSKLLVASSAIDVTYSVSVFNQISHPTIFLYNTFISSLLKTTDDHRRDVAFSLYRRILSTEGVEPNCYTFPSLIKSCFQHRWFECGKLLHCHLVKFIGVECDQFVLASLVNLYAKIGDLSSCRYIFEQISVPDLVTWNTVISAYACGRLASGCGDWDVGLSMDALYMFDEMQRRGVRPNEKTMVALISACAGVGALSQGVWAHAYLIKNDLEINVYVSTSLIDLYAKCGCLDLAYQMFVEMPNRDTLCYNAMIGGFAVHGCGRKALELFKRMSLDGLVPDDVTVMVVLSGCSHAGLVDEGYVIFESMDLVYGIEPKVEHYACLVDLLGRAGRLWEAEQCVNTMPMKPNAVVWRSLLGAARVHGSCEIGEVALENLIQLEPETSGNYVLLSNIYASMARVDDVKRVRKLMKDTAVDKMPGISLVDLNGVVHEFLMGDTTHPQSKEIYEKLEEMNHRLHEYGHKAKTKEVMFDIEQEDKESALSYHSERLAIAFAILSSDQPNSPPVRIIKNLRVCGDCHSSTELISKIYGREIIVRDRNRFHHFRDGACSCSGYW